jgi:hypothetical protein
MEAIKADEIRRDIINLCKALSWTGRTISCMPEPETGTKQRFRNSAYWDIIIDEDEEKERALTINYSVKRRPKFWIEEIDDNGDIANTVDLFSNWDKSKFEMEFARIIRK